MACKYAVFNQRRLKPVQLGHQVPDIFKVGKWSWQEWYPFVSVLESVRHADVHDIANCFEPGAENAKDASHQGTAGASAMFLLLSLTIN